MKTKTGYLLSICIVQLLTFIGLLGRFFNSLSFTGLTDFVIILVLTIAFTFFFGKSLNDFLIELKTYIKEIKQSK